MKKTISLHDFVSAFTEMGRYDQFSLEGLKVIYKYITAYESESGQEIELDVTALCCEVVELTPSEIFVDYVTSIDQDDLKDDPDLMAKAVAFLESKTMVLGKTETTIIYNQF